MNAAEVLAQVRIASPCSADWNSMTGDDRVRFCGACNKQVYNLTGMKSQEAVDLIQQHEGPICGRLYQRADGRLLVENCPIGVARIWQRVQRLAVATAGAIFVGCAAASSSLVLSSAVSSRSPHPGLMLAELTDELILDLRVWLGFSSPSPPILMGEIMPPPMPGGGTTSCPVELSPAAPELELAPDSGIENSL